MTVLIPSLVSIIFHSIPDDCSGSSVDWAKQVSGAKYAYALEVRPDFNCLIDPNCNGFISTLDQIVPSGQELFASFLAMAEAIPA